ncbi:TPA: inovirus Gp2 family protein [Klebsiella oxytoca]|nr:inovirus Gp2 family protein [Klebsiella aerogenes]HDV9908531.1 inovirus Gp2 family protein [Klebsiella oxytoca]
MSFNISSYGHLNRNAVLRIEETLNRALQEYPRTLVLRVDLRLPDFNQYDSTLMTRFIVSLKTQVNADLHRRKKSGSRVHPCHVRHIWAREKGVSGRKHYHVALFFNHDSYCGPGRYSPEGERYRHNLALMIMEAWVRALRLEHFNHYQQYYSLVEFTAKPYHALNIKSPYFETDYQEVKERLLYLAKEFSKSSDGFRNFGYSQS